MVNFKNELKCYKKALKDINKVKKMIKGLSYDEACILLAGFNNTGENFDFDFGCITGTVENDQGLAVITEQSAFDIYSSEGMIDCLTEKEIKEKV